MKYRLLSLLVFLAMTGCSLVDGGARNSCITYKEEMTRLHNSNPVLNGDRGFDDPRFEAWLKKGIAANKKIYNAFGITFYSEGSGKTFEQIESNLANMRIIAEKCLDAGVDIWDEE